MGAELGEVIGGYRLDRMLQTGSTSCVFLGTHVRLGRAAAIKVLAPELVDNAQTMGRFLAEARVVNDIRHPNIIDIYDFVDTEAPRRVALVMAYIRGPSLHALEVGALSTRQLLGVGLQLVDAAEAAHKAGVVHRDLKPANLLLTSEPSLDANVVPTLKIVDFGIAKIAGDGLGYNPATAVMIGSPAYMAPEQIAGSPPPSGQTDVYAIGEILYELITGQRAYQASSPDAVVRTKLRGEAPKLEIPSHHPLVGLLPVIQSALNPKMNARPTLVEIREALVALGDQSDDNAVALKPDEDEDDTVLDVPLEAVRAAQARVAAKTEGEEDDTELLPGVKLAQSESADPKSENTTLQLPSAPKGDEL